MSKTQKRKPAPPVGKSGSGRFLADRYGERHEIVTGTPFLERGPERYSRDYLEARVGPLVEA